MSIILCGPPFCGKTYFGKRLSDLLDWYFVDTDLLIEQQYSLRYGKDFSCREIVLTLGEKTFRQIEMEVISSLPFHEKSVIAIGGGTLLEETNAKFLKSIGKLIFLKTAFNTLWERLNQKSILPSYIDRHFPKTSFLEIVELRNALCSLHADTSIEICSQPAEEVLDYLLQYCRSIHGQ